MRVIWILALAMAAPSTAGAGGIVVPGAGPQAQARAGAFVAKSDDPTAIVHNPAGFSRMDGTHVMLGVNLVEYDMRFTRDGRYESIGADSPDYVGEPFPAIENEAQPSVGVFGFQAIPTISMSTDLGHPEWPVRFGVGLVAPQGFPERDYPLTVDVPGATDTAPAPQRYDIVQQDARIILPSIAVAYTPFDALSIGVRAGWGISSTRGQKVVWSVRNYEEDPGSDSIFTVEAEDNFVPGAAIGALYEPIADLVVGAAYTLPLEIRSKGTGSSMVGGGLIEGLKTVPVEDQFARCEPGGTEDNLNACLNIDIPQMFTLGVRRVFRAPDGSERGDIELDVRWENWSSASNTIIIVDGRVQTSEDPPAYVDLNESVNKHGFRDVFSFRLGGAYKLLTAPIGLTARGGISHDTAAAPDSWVRVDIDGKARTLFTAGVAIETSSLRIDFGGGFGYEPDITVAPCKPPDGPTVDDPGCSSSGETPFDDRDQPDPGQPLRGPKNQIESPFNAGLYESHYVLLSLGVTTWF